LSNAKFFIVNGGVINYHIHTSNASYFDPTSIYAQIPDISSGQKSGILT